MVDVPGVINWPASPDTAATLLQVRDLASTTLTAPIDAVTLTIPVASTAGWPATGAVTIEGEHIPYTSKTATQVNASSRGAFMADGGSAPAAHDTGAVVGIKVIAAAHRVLVDAILALQAKQGAGADTPAAGDFNKGTGTGASGWSPLTGSEVNTALGYTAASDVDLDAHMAASNPHSGSQPLDAELTAIAALTSAADRLPYFTGAGAAGLATFTAAGRAIVDDADNAAQRTTLGLGSIATQGANAVAITGGAITGITDLAIADGGTGASDAATARTNLGLAIGTNVQAQDAELQAIAGLTSAANKGIQFTGAGTAATYDLTAAGKALLDDPDAATQRATLGLVIGTNVQAQDAELQAIAGLTSAANKLPYFTGSGAAALADLTAAGRALLDDADAAAQRATLGLSFAAVLDPVNAVKIHMATVGEDTTTNASTSTYVDHILLGTTLPAGTWIVHVIFIGTYTGDTSASGQVEMRISSPFISTTRLVTYGAGMRTTGFCTGITEVVSDGVSGTLFTGQFRRTSFSATTARADGALLLAISQRTA